ncbi:MAG: DUF2065 domain-containing protein [Deltaproteobacteria bacterium]|nr:DUF2065 domain-containing protein [Deltaproteobacteria bacterium]
MYSLVLAIGVVLVIEGIPYFIYPAKVKQWALLVQDIPDSTLRILGVASMALGLFILFITRFFAS